ncbi:MAG TPA: prepilin-type N-terminal cleavage/methylation domain-containing protein [Chthoniobacteraceae bacterium]|nr:prepilin-type N-terminal cleavage/methylation domain-containing protein [Chthoniobacteraceae bacterium]
MTAPLTPGRDRRGVTLPELLIAITIIAVLIALALPTVGLITGHLQNAKCIQNLRQIGVALSGYAGDHQQTIPTPYNDLQPGDHPNQSWATRLLLGGYIGDPNTLFCPSFYPRNQAQAIRKPGNDGAVQCYGMRKWVPPGTLWLNDEIAIGSRPLASIPTPATFFLIADSYWTPDNWKSQGYAISPALKEHRVHLRHGKKANALFMDGHVEAKTDDYFKSLSKPDAEGGQRLYTGGREKEIYTIE